MADGTEGWDEYAPFYDWENARTLGRRDVPFWRRLARRASGPVLELGCGTGRVSWPLARAGVDLIGIDRSRAMIARSARRVSRKGSRPCLVRGDIRSLPFRDGGFSMVLAPYGVLQSLLSDRDFAATLTAVARVLRRGGLFAVDVVLDVPHWREYRNRVQLRGRAAGGRHLTLVESVRQDVRRRRTTFEQRYIEQRRGRRTEHRFELTFRTLSVRAVANRLRRAGFEVESVLGDYDGRPWDSRADVWILLARRR
jgi:ubiquinone/menaquinone biosynthesis C-methylase UbiE